MDDVMTLAGIFLFYNAFNFSTTSGLINAIGKQTPLLYYSFFSRRFVSYNEFQHLYSNKIHEIVATT